MLAIVHELLCTCAQCKTPHAVLRLQCVHALVRVYAEMTNWVPGTSEVKLGIAARQHVILYVELARNALRTCIAASFWRLYPKHHLFLHSREEKVWTWDNSRDIWNYVDDSEIGLAASLASSQHPKYLHTMLLEKYRCWDLVE